MVVSPRSRMMDGASTPIQTRSRYVTPASATAKATTRYRTCEEPGRVPCLTPVSECIAISEPKQVKDAVESHRGDRLPRVLTHNRLRPKSDPQSRDAQHWKIVCTIA